MSHSDSPMRLKDHSSFQYFLIDTLVTQTKIHHERLGPSTDHLPRGEGGDVRPGMDRPIQLRSPLSAFHIEPGRSAPPSTANETVEPEPPRMRALQDPQRAGETTAIRDSVLMLLSSGHHGTSAGPSSSSHAIWTQSIQAYRDPPDGPLHEGQVVGMPACRGYLRRSHQLKHVFYA